MLASGAVVASDARGAPAGADAQLIALCDQYVSLQTEWYLLIDYDESVADFGPNHARYEYLDNEKHRLFELIEERQSPTTPAGCAAMARVALTWVDLDTEGNFHCNNKFEELLVRVAEGVAPGFVWPPRPGSCSTAHWAPPTSPKEIAEHDAARHKRMAQIDAEIQAEKLAAEAESHRRGTPSLMTDEELRGEMRTLRRWVASLNKADAELVAEMAQRGLEPA